MYDGKAFVNHEGMLLKRDVVTGELLEEISIVSTDGGASGEKGEGGMVANFDSLSTWTYISASPQKVLLYIIF